MMLRPGELSLMEKLPANGCSARGGAAIYEVAGDASLRKFQRSFLAAAEGIAPAFL